MSGQEELFAPDDPKPWQTGPVYPSNLYAGGPPEEPKDRAGTSHAAARSVRLTANTMRDRVYKAVRDSADGFTDDDIEKATGFRHQTASARRRELVLLGMIVDSGRRRSTRSGRTAAVWVVKP